MKPRGYQERALNEAIAALDKPDGGGFLLSLEMRTGKTLVSLLCARHFHYPLLIVCPKVAVPVWEKAVKDLEVRRSCNGIHIIHYEALVGANKSWYRWADKFSGGFFMILDEAHFIKGRGSDRSRVVRTVAKRAKYRLALTGTPIAQGLHDAWAIYDYLGHIFGPWDDSWEGGLDGRIVPGFESTYLVYGGFGNHQIVGYRNRKQFFKIFHKHQFRITLREAKLEGQKGGMVLRYQKRYFPLNAVARGIYDALQEDLETIVNEKKIRVVNLLSCVSKLQQLAGGFVIEQIFTGRYSRKGKPIYEKKVHQVEGPGKLDLLVEQVKGLEGKFIVIARFIHELEAISEVLKAAGYSVAIVRGGMPYDGEFKTDVICMQIQSGMAVDMSKADTIVFYSVDYSFINFEQSRFRILNYEKSLGKYIFLLAEGTVDEVVYAAIKLKKKVADIVIDKYRTRGKHAVRQLEQADRRSKVQTQQTRRIRGRVLRV